ncbi:hypothetical protein [Dactylosporangium salmoneum]|uniref:Uncharacterized protein n=1 Tax=Dactylosporangium salmoneum TaxID=53361 RepID=A0ABP5UUP3_9ACTN
MSAATAIAADADRRDALPAAIFARYVTSCALAEDDDARRRRRPATEAGALPAGADTPAGRR